MFQWFERQSERDESHKIEVGRIHETSRVNSRLDVCGGDACIRDTRMMTFQFHLGQLRHLYAQMVNGHVHNAGEAAKGLLGPAIAEFEKAMTPSQTTDPRERPDGILTRLRRNHVIDLYEAEGLVVIEEAYNNYFDVQLNHDELEQLGHEIVELARFLKQEKGRGT